MSLRSIIALSICFALANCVCAQINEEFTDDNFSENPIWSGDTDEFVVSGGILNLNGPSSSNESYLVTSTNVLDSMYWEFLVNMDFNPSSSNKTFVYLVSDASNLEESLQGYYVMIGNTSDEVSLYRQDGSSSSIIIDGTDDVVDSNPVNIRVKVVRDDQGNWELFHDTSGGLTYTSEGTVFDNTYDQTNYFGILCDYSSTRSDKFSFDDILVAAAIRIDTVFALAEDSLQLVFNQAISMGSAELIANYSLDNEISINNASRDETDSAIVFLRLESELSSGSFEITASNQLSSINGNSSGPQSFSFDYTPLKLTEIVTLTDSTVQLTFDQLVDSLSLSTLENYQIEAKNPLYLEIEESLQGVIVGTNQKFEGGVSYNLTISDLFNQSLNSTLDTTISFEYIEPLLVSSVSVESKDSIIVSFTKELNASTATNINNYEIDNGIGNPENAELIDNMTVYLIIGENLQNTSYALTINDLEDTENNPISENTVSYFSYLSLEIQSVAFIEDTLRLTFNQGLDSLTAINPNNYLVNYDIGSPVHVGYNGQEEVTLLFEGLVNNNYLLQVDSLVNKTGNSTLSIDSIAFEVDKPTAYWSLRINEILADPTPQIGLPDAEFVELYNSTDSYVNLQDFQLADGMVSNGVIPPNEYAILCDPDDSTSFSNYGLVIPVTSLPTLTNSGRDLVLRDNLGNLIDSIYYDTDTYKDKNKEDGGFTLELINQNLPCSGTFNWIASESETGGTPGMVNSVLDNSDDTKPPAISLINIISEDSIQVLFNEPVIPTNVSVTIETVDSVTLTWQESNELLVVLSNPLTSESYYDINCYNLEDCSGNSGDDLSTIYFDEKPPEYVRIILNSSSKISLVSSEPLDESTAEIEENYWINDTVPTKAELDSGLQIVALSFDFEFQESNSYELWYTNLSDTLENTITDTLSTSFVYEQHIDTIKIVAGNLIDVYFKVAVDPLSGTSTQNFWIEGVGNPNKVLTDQENGKLFHLILPSSLQENKELELTINDLKTNTVDFLNTPTYYFTYDTKGPSIQSISVADSSCLIITYNENVEQVSSESVINYEWNELHPVSASQIAADEIVLCFNESFLTEQPETIRIKDVKDIQGNRMSSTRSVDFIYDPIPPRVDSIFQLSIDSLQIRFTEAVDSTTSTSVTNYWVSNGISPAAVLRNPFNFSEVYLGFADALPEDMNLRIGISGIKDLNDNLINDTLDVFINTLNPTISRITPISNDAILIAFSKPMNPESLIEEHFKIQNSIVPKVEIIIAGNQCKINFDSMLEDGKHYTLNFENIIDTSDNLLLPDSIQFLFDDYFETYEIFSDKVIALNFDDDLSESGIDQFLLGTLHPISIHQPDENREQVQLFFAEPIPHNVDDTIYWSGLTSLDGQVIPDNEIPVVIDTEAPEIISVTSSKFNFLLVEFSEPIESNSALSLNHYELSENGNPESISQLDESKILLEFQTLLDNHSYDLIISRVSDLQANLVEDTIAFTFQYPYVPEPGDLLITEIMADPSPAIGLPEYEYVEIYNTSDSSIILDLLHFGDPSVTIDLPSYSLSGKEYLLLTGMVAQSSFPDSIQVIGIPGFPSLGNSGDSLFIKFDSTNIDLVHYEREWYHDTDKDDGGYSLEKISFNPACSEIENWVASISEVGGTPGFVNSVFNNNPDTIAPSIVDIQILSESRIGIDFSETMNTSTIGSVQLNPFDQSISVDFHNNYQILIDLSSPLDSSILYNLDIADFFDCANNKLTPFSTSIGIGKDPQPGELRITELMPDPSPPNQLPESEFVEILNATDHLINLEEVYITDEKDTAFLENLIRANEYLIIVSNASYSDFTSFGSVIGVTNFPSLNNSGEPVRLLKGNQEIDAIMYNRDWYHDTDKDDGGYSIEIINPYTDCTGQSNWSVSLDEEGGTPGNQNSIFDLSPDLKAPMVISFSYRRDTIEFTFDERVDITNLENGSITISPSLPHDKFLPGHELNQIWLPLTETPETGILYEITFGGIKDCSGNQMNAETFEFGVGKEPTFHELLITELMIDPEPSNDLPVSEYIEILNNTNNLIDLSGVTLSDSKESSEIPGGFLKPGQYALLIPMSSFSEFPENLNKIGVSNWPSLDNKSDHIKLTINNLSIHDINYTSDWYDDIFFEGGNSLEMIDPSNTCGEDENWTISISATGGTPGFLNSVNASNPDLKSPELISADAIDEHNILLTFNEKLLLESISTIEISEDILVEQLQPLTDTRQINIACATLIPNIEYEVTITGISDCNGNVASQLQHKFILPEISDSTDLIINEVLFNPTSTGVDFVEVLNKSNKFINLKNWYLSNDSHDIHPISTGHMIIAPGEVSVFTTSKDIIINEYPKSSDEERIMEIEQLPSFPNSSGTVILYDSAKNVIDLFNYNEDLHFSLLDNTDGVSLERISKDGNSNDPNNWTSTSSTSGFSTPGRPNSNQFNDQNTVFEKSILIEPKTFIAGQTSGAVPSFTKINYQFESVGNFAQISIFSASGQLVKTISNGDLLNTSGFFRWDGDNNSGAIVDPGYYIIHFMIYNNQGFRKKFRKTVVVAGDF